MVPLPSGPIKMEDRKRSAGHSIDDIAPPTKRQATNGTSKASADSDMPWKDFIEVSLVVALEYVCLSIHANFTFQHWLKKQFTLGAVYLWLAKSYYQC